LNEPPTDPLTAAREHAQVRKVALADLLRGRARSDATPAREPRDRSFDGGARQPVPLPRDPVRDHDALVGQLAGLSRVFRGGF
jgi:hypothetical protein